MKRLIILALMVTALIGQSFRSIEYVEEEPRSICWGICDTDQDCEDCERESDEQRQQRRFLNQ